MSFFNYFLDPVKNHYADFSGRVTRKQYWVYVLFMMVFCFIFGVIDELLGTGFIVGLFALIILIPSIAVAARRLHDTGMSGWWQLISLIPFVGAIILIILLARKSQEGENRYGSNPHMATAEK